jgi:dipeptidase D
MKELAAAAGLKVRQDATGNLLIEAPASPGFEKAAPTLLQGHIDMVCEKNSGTKHDFDRDPIRLMLDRGDDGQPVVRADGTTLGADNGIGVCLALAAATSPDVQRGPLEILLTYDEEAGMTGAKSIEKGFFKSKRMINLDSEEDDALYIGCAGGTDVNLSWSLPTEPASGQQAVRVFVSGLRGGHSGSDIHTNRANAIKLLAGALLAAGDNGGGGMRLAELSGGSKRNAIPREAAAVVCGPAGLVDALRHAFEQACDAARSDNGDAGCTISVEPAQAKAAASAEGTARVLRALAAIPSGVLAVFPEIPGLVQTSNNLSTVESGADGGTLRIAAGCLARSASEAQMERTVRLLRSVAALAGADSSTGNEYPGWNPDVKSPLLASCKKVYAEVFGHEPKVMVIHAGLECGIIGRRVGGLDMVSFGPNITGAHSPDERVYPDSVAKMWTYLTAVLRELARG